MVTNAKESNMAHVVRAWRASRMIRLLAVIALLVTATQLVPSGDTGGVQGTTRQTVTIGKDRLVSFEPLPPMDGVMCPFPEDAPGTANPELIASLQLEQRIAALQQWVSPSLMAASLQQSGAAGAAPPRPGDAVRAAVAKRTPITTVKDPRNAFAAIAIDPIRNEVVLADENNFSLLVYDRLENTPPRAALSEPKRTIVGHNTYLEFACGVYIDPKTGEIYSINNDTLRWMTVFDRSARGDVSPTRKLATPQATFGIVADEESQELLMTVQNDHAVIVFKKAAKDEEAPVRLLQGPKTLMADPHGIALDPKAGLMYVTNWGTNADWRGRDVIGPRGPNWSSKGSIIPGTGKFGSPSITVYRKDAHGDIAPLRVIQGPRTLLNWPTSIAVHPDRGELFVANDTGDSVTVYRADATGDAAPIRVIKGPRSMVKNPLGVAVDLTNNELWVANFGSHSATVFPVDASGDPAPKRVIRTGRPDEPSALIANPHTIAYDTKREEILVSN
jgi:DNA-binding beta-propeller fold protein YncE